MGTDNVREVGSENSSGNKKGRVFVVDPNPPGMDVIPPEDMFIYVKFSAYPRSRTTYGGNTLEGDPIIFDSGIEGEVHFISTKISYKDGQLDPPLQKTYATTDWTNIGGFKSENTRSQGILEGFGIKSIDIKYNASLVPVVDITFTDVRGSGLFDVIKDDDRKSPYSIFFKMPYPVFRLSVKGYFGQKVDYCLHMVNWTSNFDGSTGNFDISANFLGFQQAFLNDMVIGNIIGAVNTQQGFNNLNRIYDESGSDIGTLPDGKNIRKLDEFFTKISRIQVDSEIIKSELSSFEYLKDLNGKLNILKSIRTFIGTHMGKQPVFNSNGSTNPPVEDSTPYLELENINNKIFTAPIRDNNLQNNSNYLSIRDYIVFNDVNRASFKSYTETLTDIILKYQSYLEDDDRKEYKPQNTLSELSEKTKQKLSGVPSDENKKTGKDSELIESFYKDESETNWENYIVLPTKDAVTKKVTSVRLENIIDDFSSKNSNIYLKNDYDPSSEKNSNFEMSIFTGNTQFYNRLKKDTSVLVADFRKQRELVEDRIKELEITVKAQREAVQLEINERLLINFKRLFGFNPTIDNCFEIIANNTQAMVETIYDISAEAEQKSKSDNRDKILSGYETDVPTGIQSVAWPTVYRKNGDGSLEEIYIGELGSVNKVDFPEYRFTEEVFEILIAKEKELDEISRASVLKSGLDTDNWFPINPIDYKINPWIKLNVLNTKKEIKEELAKQIFFRIALLKNYSRFDANTGLSSIQDYANFESIAANKTIFSKNVRGVLGNLLVELKNGTDTLLDTDFFKDNINNLGNKYTFKEDNVLPTYNDFDLSGKYSENANYILFDESAIINNTKQLYKEIKEEPNYSKITDPNNGGNINKKEEGDELFYLNKYSTANNFTTNNIYNVWGKSVGKNLFISSSNQINENLNNTKLLDFNPSGNTYGSDYLNITNFNLGVSTSTCNFEDILTQSELYSNQPTNYARALLLLSTFPFRTFKEGFLNSIFPNNIFSGARIVKLPSLYVYYLGGLLWRYEKGLNSEQSIDFTILKDPNNTTNNGCPYTSKVDSSYDEYLNLGFLKGYSTIKKIPLEDSLKQLPASVKKVLIDKFKNWVDTSNRFNDNLNGDFEINMTYYVNDNSNVGFSSTITEKQKTDGQNYIFSSLKETTDLIILNPNIFNPNRDIGELEVVTDQVDEYIRYFSLKFDEVEKNNNNGSSTNTEEEQKSKNESILPIKLGIYNYFKNINSKWVGSEKRSFNICGGSDTKDLIDYFRFVDRGWADIGDKATFNLKSFLTLGSNLNTSVYFFISKLLRDSNFLFQILPTYINYKDKEEVAKIFQPQTTLKNNESSGPIFCCIYVGGASDVLDIEERNNYYFKNDGFSFDENGNEIPADMVGSDKNSLVAFRVSFGAQNQTVFKNVSLSQQEHKETGEYFRALSDLVDKRGGTQKTYVGTDLLRLFKTRSYTCKVDALGCMNIQPLMYFDLQNVPFFNGAYLITSVNHNISPNHMTTNFQGVRQSKFISPPTEEITADLDIDLNETSETPKIEFTNLGIESGLYTIGVRDGIEPNDKFNYTVNLTGGKLKTLGVIRETDEELDELARIITEVFQDGPETQQLLSNAQVTMALTAMLANSNNLNSKEKDVERGSQIRDNDNNILYYSKDLTGITDRIINEYKDSYLASIPLPVIAEESKTAWTLKGNPNLDESEQNKRIEKGREIINDKINALDTTNPNYAKNKEKLEKELKNLDKQEDDLIKLPYYNILPGDAYRFRPRGYLYLVGRKNYYNLNEVFGGGAITKDLIINPNEVTSTEKRLVTSSLLVWKNLKDDTNKSAYDYSSLPNDGSSATFGKCIDIVHQGLGPSKEVTYNTFQKVLTTFVGEDNQPLIDYNNPRGGV
jgi:hypothetical protein